MIKYTRIPNDKNGYRYTKNNILTKESRIPMEVMEKFDINPVIEYDERPEKRRCTMCDGYQSRQRYLNSKLWDLCEWHYQHARLGQLSKAIKENEEEAIKAAAKYAELTPQQKRKKTLRAKKRSALSALVS